MFTKSDPAEPNLLEAQERDGHDTKLIASINTLLKEAADTKARNHGWALALVTRALLLKWTVGGIALTASDVAKVMDRRSAPRKRKSKTTLDV